MFGGAAALRKSFHYRAKFIHRETLVGAPARPRNPPYTTFYYVRRRSCSAKIFSSQAENFTRKLWSARPPSRPALPLLLTACLPRASARSPRAAARIPPSVAATCRSAASVAARDYSIGSAMGVARRHYTTLDPSHVPTPRVKLAICGANQLHPASCILVSIRFAS